MVWDAAEGWKGGRHVLLCACLAGGSGGIAAASSLLSRHLPAALGAPLEEFLLAMEAGGGGGGSGEEGSQQQPGEELAGQAAELRCGTRVVLHLCRFMPDA